eukprot:scaffold10196_cov129-Isochrysis_galbana.AAC.3
MGRADAWPDVNYREVQCTGNDIKAPEPDGGPIFAVLKKYRRRKERVLASTPGALWAVELARSTARGPHPALLTPSVARPHCPCEPDQGSSHSHCS